MPLGNLYVFGEESSSAHFSVGLFFIVVVDLYELFVYIGDYVPVGCFVCKDFLLFCGLSFLFLMVSFAVQKLLSLMMSHWFLFCSVFIAIILGVDQKDFAVIYGKGFNLCFPIGVL